MSPLTIITLLFSCVAFSTGGTTQANIYLVDWLSGEFIQVPFAAQDTPPRTFRLALSRKAAWDSLARLSPFDLAMASDLRVQLSGRLVQSQDGAFVLADYANGVIHLITSTQGAGRSTPLYERRLRISALDVDKARDMVYWVEYPGENSLELPLHGIKTRPSIMRARIGLPRVEEIELPINHVIYDLRVDSEGQQVFVIESNVISVISLDGSSRSPPLNIAPGVQWIELDASHRRVYWYNKYFGTVESCHYDGTGYRIAQLQNPPPVSDVQINPEVGSISLACVDGTVKVFDLDSGLERLSSTKFHKGFSSLGVDKRADDRLSGYGTTWSSAISVWLDAKTRFALLFLVVSLGVLAALRILRRMLPRVCFRRHRKMLGLSAMLCFSLVFALWLSTTSPILDERGIGWYGGRDGTAILIQHGGMVIRTKMIEGNIAMPLGCGFYAQPFARPSSTLRRIGFVIPESHRLRGGEREILCPLWLFACVCCVVAIACIRLREDPMRCVNCSYMLRGNTNGVCSECGAPIGEAQRERLRGQSTA